MQNTIQKNILLMVIYSIFLTISQSVLANELDPSEISVINKLIKNYSKDDIDDGITETEIDINKTNKFSKPSAIKTSIKNNDNDENREEIVKSNITGINLEIEHNHGKESVADYLDNAYKAYQLGHYEVALMYYKKAEALEPKNDEVQFGIAVSHHKLGHIDHAKRYYISILEDYPENRLALNNFLSILSYEKPDAALTTLRRLEAAEPNLSIIPAQIAIIYERQKDYKNAIKYFKKANKLEPSNLDYLYNIAVLFEKNRETNNAVILYNKIMEAMNAGYKSNVSYKEVKERINNIAVPQFNVKSRNN